jgi:hypothetical protein
MTSLAQVSNTDGLALRLISPPHRSASADEFSERLVQIRSAALAKSVTKCVERDPFQKELSHLAQIERLDQHVVHAGIQTGIFSADMPLAVIAMMGVRGSRRIFSYARMHCVASIPLSSGMWLSMNTMS